MREDAPTAAELEAELFFGVTGDNGVAPLRLGVGAFGGEDFDGVAVLELVAKWLHLAIDHKATSARRQIGMDTIGKVQRVSAIRQIPDVTLGRIHEYPVMKQLHA